MDNMTENIILLAEQMVVYEVITVWVYSLEFLYSSCILLYIFFKSY